MTDINPQVRFMAAAKAMADAIAADKKVVEVGSIPKDFIAVPKSYLTELVNSYGNFRNVLIEIAAAQGTN